MNPSYQMPGFIERDLANLGELIGKAAARHGFSEYEANPAANVGAALEFPNFSMRSYCWCDGFQPGHETGCPPNFEVPSFNFAAEWYKYLGRSSEVNRIPERSEWRQIMNLCENQIQEQMADYEFTRKQVRPNTAVNLFDESLQPAEKPLTSAPRAMTFQWRGKDYAAVKDDTVGGYDIHLIAPTPPLQVGPARMDTATLNKTSLLGHLSDEELDLRMYPSPEQPTYWGNWITSAIFSNPIFAKEAISASVEYNEPTEDELDFLQFEAEMRAGDI